eukprot:scaffold1375_cov137-Cylindrotheca_fusiformis.AAC.20
MYGHHSSARVGVGKQGHGGRPYRPPRPRRDPNSTPPPLKECSCLLQIDIPEYQSPQPAGRMHVSFGGREAVQDCERFLRTNFLVHLVVPGRKQQGPVAIAGSSYKETIPAAAHLISKLQSVQENSYHGKVQLNVKNPREPTIAGTWNRHSMRADNGEGLILQPFWLFQSAAWSVLVCPISTRQNELLPSGNGRAENDDCHTNSDGDQYLSLLRSCVENLTFRVGSLQGLDIFIDDFPPAAFAVGDPHQATMLLEEIAGSY